MSFDVMQNEPQLIRAIRAENEFKNQVAEVYGAEHAEENFHRLRTRLQMKGRRTEEIVGLMMP